MTPPAAHAPTISAGECTCIATTCGLMKMPDPMIPPITIIVASNGPRRRARVAMPHESSRILSGSVSRAETSGTPQSERPEDRRRLHRLHPDPPLAGHLPDAPSRLVHLSPLGARLLSDAR